VRITYAHGTTLLVVKQARMRVANEQGTTGMEDTDDTEMVEPISILECLSIIVVMSDNLII
jgi:hypothetical protein